MRKHKNVCLRFGAGLSVNGVVLRLHIPQTGGCAVPLDQLVAFCSRRNFLLRAHTVGKSRALLELKFCCRQLSMNHSLSRLQTALFTVGHFSLKTYYTRQRKSWVQGQIVNTSHRLNQFSVTVEPYYITCNFSLTGSADSEAKNNPLLREEPDWLFHQVATVKVACVHAP